MSISALETSRRMHHFTRCAVTFWTAQKAISRVYEYYFKAGKEEDIKGKSKPFY